MKFKTGDKVIVVKYHNGKYAEYSDYVIGDIATVLFLQEDDELMVDFDIASRNGTRWGHSVHPDEVELLAVVESPLWKALE